MYFQSLDSMGGMSRTFHQPTWDETKCSLSRGKASQDLTFPCFGHDRKVLMNEFIANYKS